MMPKPPGPKRERRIWLGWRNDGPKSRRYPRCSEFIIAKEIQMKFRPLHDRVVVKRIDAEDKSAGGIIIPDTAKEKPSQGEVIAVGPGGRDDNGKLIAIDLK